MDNIYQYLSQYDDQITNQHIGQVDNHDANQYFGTFKNQNANQYIGSDNIEDFPGTMNQQLGGVEMGTFNYTHLSSVTPAAVTIPIPPITFELYNAACDITLMDPVKTLCLHTFTPATKVPIYDNQAVRFWDTYLEETYQQNCSMIYDKLCNGIATIYGIGPNNCDEVASHYIRSKASKRLIFALEEEAWIDNLLKNSSYQTGVIESARNRCEHTTTSLSFTGALENLCFLALYWQYTDINHGVKKEEFITGCTIEAKKFCLRIIEGWTNEVVQVGGKGGQLLAKL